MTSLPVYSAREVRVIWGFPMDGFSGDNIVKMSYNSDLTTETVSADGKLATSVTPDRTGTITVELMATSESNRILSALLAYQNNQPNTAAILKTDFAVLDPSGSVLCYARQAYLKKAPEVGLGVETGTYEWTFCTEKLEFLNVPKGVKPDSAFIKKVEQIAGGITSALAR